MPQKQAVSKGIPRKNVISGKNPTFVITAQIRVITNTPTLRFSCDSWHNLRTKIRRLSQGQPAIRPRPRQTTRPAASLGSTTFPTAKCKRAPQRVPFPSQSRKPQDSDGSISLQAAIRPFTASTDLSNIACSTVFILISAIRSIPPAPMIVGTPTYMPFTPSSPLQ